MALSPPLGLEIARRNGEGPGNSCPFFEIAEPGPAGNTVINDEEVSTLTLRTHGLAQEFGGNVNLPAMGLK